MEQHSIPRQITSFEFKLIGFMTLKQFLYLVIFGACGFVAYMMFPISVLNVIVGIIVFGVGPVSAFVPINDRPMDVMLRNLWKRLNSPTQYFFRKENAPIAIFQNLYFVTDPHRVMAHVESQKMLASYLAATRQTMVANAKKQEVQKVVQAPTSALRVQAPSRKVAGVPVFKVPTTASIAAPVTAQPVEKKPFFIGAIKNKKQIPLPGILIYVKDQAGNPVRLLKSNPHGVFATYNPLPVAEYTFEMKDPKNIYFFDTMKLGVADSNPKPFEFISKEMM